MPGNLPHREMLRGLLDSGQLTPSEAETAGKIHGDLVGGGIGGLNYQQGAWTQRLCQRVGISMHEARPTVSKAQAEKERQLTEFDAMPRPKKPPGR